MSPIRQLLERLTHRPCEPALAWADTLPAHVTPEKAYGQCDRPEWTTWLACTVGVPTPVIVAAVLQVLREVVPGIAGLDPVIGAALDDLDAWVAAGGPGRTLPDGPDALDVIADDEEPGRASPSIHHHARVLYELRDASHVPPSAWKYSSESWTWWAILSAIEHLGSLEPRVDHLAEQLRAALPWSTIAPFVVASLRPADPREEAHPPRG